MGSCLSGVGRGKWASANPRQLRRSQRRRSLASSVVSSAGSVSPKSVMVLLMISRRLARSRRHRFQTVETLPPPSRPSGCLCCSPGCLIRVHLHQQFRSREELSTGLVNSHCPSPRWSTVVPRHHHEAGRGPGQLLVNGSSFLKGSWRGVEKEQFQIEHIATAGIQNVHAVDGLPPLVDIEQSVRYLVCPVLWGRAWLTSSYNDILMMLTVRELVKGGVSRLAQVAVQLGHGSGSSYLFVAFLEDDLVTAWQVDR